MFPDRSLGRRRIDRTLRERVAFLEPLLDENAADCVVAAVGVPCVIGQVRADDGFDFEGAELVDLHAAAEIGGV